MAPIVTAAVGGRKAVAKARRARYIRSCSIGSCPRHPFIRTDRVIASRARFFLLASALAAVCATACVSERHVALERGFPRKRIFRPEELSRLAPDQSYFFAEHDRGGSQSLCVLQLAPGATVKKQYHAEHDLTLSVVSGEAIVWVEKTRYLVGPGSALLLPRLTAYSILPQDDSEEFVALMVFSPGFDEKDVVLEE